MLDVRATTIIYQAQVYYTNLINSLVATKSLGKQRDADWRKADEILGYLQTWNYEPNLQTDQDTTNYNYILYKLIQLCGIVQYGVGSPLALQAPTYLLQGQTGPAGASVQGPRGLTGLATDFNVGPSTISILVDSFPITSAKAARWDYLVIGTANASRAGSVIGHWTPDGSSTECADTADNDLISTTDGIEFDIQFSGGTIFLIAIITSGNWLISGSRYFIPNNGDGTGPISGLLPNGQVYIGNVTNLAQPQSLTGAFTITNTGVATLSNDIIFDANINASAAISLSKLAALTPNQIVVTDSLGLLTTIAAPSPTNIAFFDINSSLTSILNTKLTNPTTSVGDLIYRNGSNNIARLPIGSSNQVLTVIGGVPLWQTPIAGFPDPMTSVGDIIIRNGGNITSRLGIGSTNQVLTVSGGVPIWSNPAATGVTSVGYVQPAAGFKISGTNPITSTGTFTFTLSDDLAQVEALASTGIVRRTAPNVWSAGSTVSIGEGGTNLTAYATGDLLYSPSTNTLGRLGIGSTGQILTVSGGLPAWSSLGTALGTYNSRYAINATVLSSYTIPTQTVAGIYTITLNGGGVGGISITLPDISSAYTNNVCYIVNITNFGAGITVVSQNGGSIISTTTGATGLSSYTVNTPSTGTTVSTTLMSGAGTTNLGPPSGGISSGWSEIARTPVVQVIKPVNVATGAGADLTALNALATSGTYSLGGTISPDGYFAPNITFSFGFSSDVNSVKGTFNLQRSINGGGSWTTIKTVTYVVANSSTIMFGGFSHTDTIDNTNNRLYRISWTTSGGNFNVTTNMEYSYKFILI